MKALTMFKFTIRETILLTIIVAVLLMWWMERARNSPRVVASPTLPPQGIAATIHASPDVPYSKLDSTLKAIRLAGVEDITIAPRAR